MWHGLGDMLNGMLAKGKGFGKGFGKGCQTAAQGWLAEQNAGQGAPTRQTSGDAAAAAPALGQSPGPEMAQLWQGFGSMFNDVIGKGKGLGKGWLAEQGIFPTEEQTGQSVPAASPTAGQSAAEMAAATAAEVEAPSEGVTAAVVVAAPTAAADSAAAVAPSAAAPKAEDVALAAEVAAPASAEEVAAPAAPIGSTAAGEKGETASFSMNWSLLADLERDVNSLLEMGLVSQRTVAEDLLRMHNGDIAQVVTILTGAE